MTVMTFIEPPQGAATCLLAGKSRRFFATAGCVNPRRREYRLPGSVGSTPRTTSLWELTYVNADVFKVTF